MRSSLARWILALLIGAMTGNAFAAVAVYPGDGCPTGEAIDENLERLGVRIALAQLGTAEVRVQYPALQVSFRDHRGESLGVRVLTATGDCGTRATLAAAVIAAFIGDWVQTKLADGTTPAAPPPAAPPPAAPPPAAPPPAATTTAATTPAATTRQPWQAELGAATFGIYDGDAGSLGFGARADLNRGALLATTLVEGTLDRERPLGYGRGAYRFLRAGLGLGVRQQGPRIFWDVTLLPMIERLSLMGKNLRDREETTTWDFVLAGHARLGWSGRRWRPFLFIGASYSTPGQRMTLTNSETKELLSPFNVQAGLGISSAISR